jgi:hypothetical protein
MAFVAASSPKVPANRQYPVASRASGDGPDTAQYGLVWPNEWPNGEIHARDDERARGARNGRDRSYRHGVGGSSKQHERTGVTAGALSGQLAASLPAGLAAASDLTIAIYHRPARGRRAPAGEAWVLAGIPSLTRSSTRVASGRSNPRADDCSRPRSSGLDLHACSSSPSSGSRPAATWPRPPPCTYGRG